MRSICVVMTLLLCGCLNEAVFSNAGVGPMRGSVSIDASSDAYAVRFDTRLDTSASDIVISTDALQDTLPVGDSLNCVQHAIANGYAGGTESCNASRALGSNEDTPANCQKWLDCLAANWPCNRCCWTTCQQRGHLFDDGSTKQRVEAITGSFCGAYWTESWWIQCSS